MSDMTEGFTALIDAIPYLEKANAVFDQSSEQEIAEKIQEFRQWLLDILDEWSAHEVETQE